MDNTSLPPLRERIAELLNGLDPESLLVIDREDLPIPPRFQQRLTRLPGTRVPEALSQVGRLDLALIDSAAEIQPDAVAIALSQLRDLYARRVLAVVRESASTPWLRHAMIGYGYTAFGHCDDGGVPVALYQFDIATYKTTPDWLNPRHWANPELWDKYRW